MDQKEIIRWGTSGERGYIHEATSKRSIRKIDGEPRFNAVYRPSLQDTFLSSGSEAIAQQFNLVPPPNPAIREQFAGKAACTKLHLEHQVWRPEQGCFFWTTCNGGGPLETIILPRLGVSIAVDTVHDISPADEYWRGQVSLRLFLSLQETLGILVDEKTQDVNGGLARAIGQAIDSWVEPPDHGTKRWQKDIANCKEKDKEFIFLRRIFGIDFYNHQLDDLVDDDYETEMRGPKRFEDMQIVRRNGMSVLTGCWKLKGTFREDYLDLRSYPFDICAWNCLVTCIGYSPGVVYATSYLPNLTEFEIFGLRGLSTGNHVNKWFPYALETNVLPNAARIPEGFIYGRFYSRRLYGYTAMNIIMPIGLISTLGLIAMAAAAAASSGTWTGVNFGTDPVAIQSTGLLTIIAFKFAFADSLPKLGYNTMLDRYICSMIALTVGSMFFMILPIDSEGYDLVSPWIYLAIDAIIHLLFIWSAYQQYVLKEDYGKIYTVQHDEDEVDAKRPNFVDVGFISRSQRVVLTG